MENQLDEVYLMDLKSDEYVHYISDKEATASNEFGDKSD